jgi:RNA polymerase sigma-70 factor (ECF subfamily)
MGSEVPVAFVMSTDDRNDPFVVAHVMREKGSSSIMLGSMDCRDEIQTALISLESGDKRALDILMPALYNELHRLAEALLSRERQDHTLQPTALVHEAYLRLIGQYRVDWSCRAQIVGLAATMMRRILVKYAQTRNAQKRDWGNRIPLEDDLCITASGKPDALMVDAALNKLEQIDSKQARIVELRFFSGLSVEETAAVMDLSTATIKREWKIARMWLMREMG